MTFFSFSPSFFPLVIVMMSPFVSWYSMLLSCLWDAWTNFSRLCFFFRQQMSNTSGINDERRLFLTIIICFFFEKESWNYDSILYRKKRPKIDSCRCKECCRRFLFSLKQIANLVTTLQDKRDAQRVWSLIYIFPCSLLLSYRYYVHNRRHLSVSLERQIYCSL
jgi:hypothetical protein